MSLLHPYKSFSLILIITNCNYNLPVNNGHYIFTNLASQKTLLFFSASWSLCSLIAFREQAKLSNAVVCNVMFDLELKNAASGFWPVFYVAEAENC